jgi:hypothetical protein
MTPPIPFQKFKPHTPAPIRRKKAPQTTPVTGIQLDPALTTADVDTNIDWSQTELKSPPPSDLQRVTMQLEERAERHEQAFEDATTAATEEARLFPEHITQVELRIPSKRPEYQTQVIGGMPQLVGTPEQAPHKFSDSPPPRLKRDAQRYITGGHERDIAVRPVERTEGMVIHKPAATGFEQVGARHYADGSNIVANADEPPTMPGALKPRTLGMSRPGSPVTPRTPERTGTEDEARQGKPGHMERQQQEYRRLQQMGRGTSQEEEEGTQEPTQPVHVRRPPRPRHARRRRGREREDRDVERRQYVQIRPLQQTMPVMTQPQVIYAPPRASSGDAGGVREKDKKPGISIKISNKNIINERKRRKVGLRKAKKEYTKLKKQATQAIRKGRMAHYKAENEKIKILPVKQRKRARVELRKTLKNRESKLLASLPTSTKLSLKDVERLKSIAQKLRW